MVPDFRTVLRFNDLHLKPSKLNIQKRVSYHASLYHLRNQVVVHDKYDEFMIKQYMKKLYGIRRDDKLQKLKTQLEKQE